MKFTRTGPNSAKTDLFEVKISKKDQILFIDQSGTTIVPIEIDSDRVISIWLNHFSLSRREIIKNAIDNAFDFLSIPHRFDC